MQTLRELDELRLSLTEKLGDLHRKANAAADLITTAMRYWHNPGVRFGVGVVLGFALGGGKHKPGDSSEGLVRAVIRAGLMAATSSLVTRALAPASATSDRDGLPGLPDNDHRYEVIR